MNELTISLTVADRPYKLVVDKDHEELFRKAARLIEKRIRDYSGNYAYKDKQDLLAMVALELATGSLLEEKRHAEDGVVLEKRLTEIDKTLSDYFEG